MSELFLLPDVSAEHIMDVARFAAARQSESIDGVVSRSAVTKALHASDQISSRALSAAQQLGFIAITSPGNWSFSGDSDIGFARKEELPLFFRKQLLSYPPFLIFVSQLSQGFPAANAASFAAAVLKIDCQTELALKVLRQWGTYGSLVESKRGSLQPTFQPSRLLDFGFLKRLSAAMDDDAKVRTFVVNELGPDLVADMSLRGVRELPLALADALLKYESEPRRIGDPVASLIESYCSSLFSQPVQANSLTDIATKLAQQNLILPTHRNLLFGVAGFRHPASHGPDTKTQVAWEVTSRGALIGHLLSLAVLRSLFVWTKAKKQQV